MSREVWSAFCSGHALTASLLDGTSPLHGSESEPLRRELGRACFLLEYDGT